MPTCDVQVAVASATRRYRKLATRMKMMSPICRAAGSILNEVMALIRLRAILLRAPERLVFPKHLCNLSSWLRDAPVSWAGKRDVCNAHYPGPHALGSPSGAIMSTLRDKLSRFDDSQPLQRARTIPALWYH